MKSPVGCLLFCNIFPLANLYIDIDTEITFNSCIVFSTCSIYYSEWTRTCKKEREKGLVFAEIDDINAQNVFDCHALSCLVHVPSELEKSIKFVKLTMMIDDS